MLLVLGCFTSFVYAFGENSFITHLVLSPKRQAFLGTPCSATMLLTDGVTGSSPVWGAKGKHFFESAFFKDAHLTVQEK